MAGSGVFLFAVLSRLAVEPIQWSVQWILRAGSLIVKQQSMKFIATAIVTVISDAVESGDTNV
jgi:hypothetical protein